MSWYYVLYVEMLKSVFFLKCQITKVRLGSDFFFLFFKVKKKAYITSQIIKIICQKWPCNLRNAIFSLHQKYKNENVPTFYWCIEIIWAVKKRELWSHETIIDKFVSLFVLHSFTLCLIEQNKLKLIRSHQNWRYANWSYLELK